LIIFVSSERSRRIYQEKKKATCTRQQQKKKATFILHDPYAATVAEMFMNKEE
jgi:hypothetical protein